MQLNEITCKICKEKSCAVAQLSDPELDVLNENIQKIHFRKGETLFRQGALNSHIFYLRKGLVKLHSRLSDQKDFILKICTPPKYLGLSTIFGDRINQYSATALLSTEVCIIDINIFKDLILHNGKFAYEIIADMGKDQLGVFRRCEGLTHKPTASLLAGALLFFSEEVFHRPSFDMPLTRTELGQLLASSRENATRALMQLKEDGLITIQQRHITILQPDALRQL